MRDVFPIVPATGGPIVMFAVMAVFLLGMLALFGWLATSSRRATVEASDQGLAVRGVMYGRSIPLSDLQLADADPVDASTGPHRLTVRTNGAGLPGFAAGWFRTAGGEKVLAFVTDKRRVAHIPTRNGYAVMVSVADPAALIASLRRHAL